MSTYTVSFTIPEPPTVYLSVPSDEITYGTILIGPQGAKGDKGATGPQGIQGIQGVKGDKGDTGEQGIQGAKGDTGATGPQGIQGAKGDTGATGEQGIQGAKGDKGDTGNPGATGPQGIQGIQGVKGDKGDTGEQGIQGIQGVKGDKGDTGATGNPGATGPQGIQGVKGDKGDTGDQGSSGVGVPTGGTAGQVLKKNSSTNYDTVFGNIGYADVTGLQAQLDNKSNTAHVHYINELGDVDINSVLPNQVLKYNGADWVNSYAIESFYTEIDFGNVSKGSVITTILHTGITTLSVLLPTVVWSSTLGRGAEELSIDPISVSMEPQTDTIKIIASANRGKVIGKYGIRYIVL